MARYKGKLIVLDGTDGSGKATQTALLLKRLRREGHRVATLDFPQYEGNFFGQLLRRYLRGDLGKPIHPYLVSVIYAADRWESKEKILQWLKAGHIVVLDRYVSANQIHQGSRIRNPRERREFLAWLDKLEYGIFGLPRPDLVLFLHVPAELSQRLMGNRVRDQMESDRKHQEASVRASLALVRKMNRWEKVECARGGQMLSREEIHERVFAAVRPLLTSAKRKA
ncbi:MAG: thymidylate kinase [Patescibacteria group bacterium]